MATIIRSAKPGSAWTRNDLRAFNINLVNENIATFFGNAELPAPRVRQETLVNETYPADGLPVNDNRPRENSAVDDSIAHLLRMLGYDEPDRLIRTMENVPLFMCGSDTQATIDVCVMHQDLVLLLVHQDKDKDGSDPQAQLVAQAIAAFQHNNSLLRRAGQPTLDAKVIPGIIMMGSTPVFYTIYVTAALVEAVEKAQYPAQVTTVHQLLPPVPQMNRMRRDGTSLLSNRAVILGCFEAFKQFIV